MHPDQKQVLPVFPEAITHQDGETKNDCELNASKRLVKQLREAFPNWPICVVEDSLFGEWPSHQAIERTEGWLYHFGKARWTRINV
ncbi:MAG: hypothetical protein IPL99_16030 [Candidatus Competibacteraceae bacterium]|nr:hypothetical protein [Candidatus Competibacteraceae bacterium]